MSSLHLVKAVFYIKSDAKFTSRTTDRSVLCTSRIRMVASSTGPISLFNVFNAEKWEKL